MKTRHFFLTAVLTIALTLPMFGRHNPADTAKTELKQPDLSGMMGKPTADTSVGGLRMKVWLMKGMPHDSMGMKDANIGLGNDTVEATRPSRSMSPALSYPITAGTHQIVLDVTEIASGKEIAGTSARVLIESPSKKSSSVDLKSMSERFWGPLTLNEKGEYRFTVNVSFAGVTKTTRFPYAVQ